MAKEKIPSGVIKTQQQFDKLLAFEKGKYLIEMQGEFITFQDSPLFSKQEVDYNFHRLVKSLQFILKNPSSEEEQLDAENSLLTAKIREFRVH